MSTNGRRSRTAVCRCGLRCEHLLLVEQPQHLAPGAGQLVEHPLGELRAAPPRARNRSASRSSVFARLISATSTRAANTGHSR